MKLNNKGFALTSVIYMLIVLFLMTMLLILANLAQRKVVLDKIKSDVKQELNQGGVLAQNIVTVTFDPTIGQINQTTKQVIYNEPYGELPTPTREGYKFIGWTSKNLAPEINSDNYSVYHIGGNTTSEFKTENGENYIRINGYQSSTNIDTLWILYNINIRNFYQGDYTLSFDVRSENAASAQKISKITPGGGNTIGRTGLYKRYSVNWKYNDDNLLSNIENSYDFDNDGNWHHFTSKVTIPYDTRDALIVIGNDGPNLYGENSYIDIKNIQLEPGDTATSYEPYQEYTSDTIVTKQENHTLYAMWEPLYTVTFDANGGTLSENTKQVSYNEPYGELPTPTREGYTFLGWHGKNIIDKSQSSIAGIQNEEPFKAWATPAFDNTWILNNLKPSTQYTMSFDITCTDVPEHDGNYSAGYGWFWIYDFNQTGVKIGSAKYMTIGEQLHVEATFTTPSNLHDPSINYRMLAYTNRYLKNDVGVIGTMIFSNIQLEPGDTATTYEPYQEYTSDTMVTKQENHTLYAIWEPNE